MVRVDSDVVVSHGVIAPESAYRLDCALPTLKFLLQKKALVTVMGHRGRPKGKKVAALSLAPVQKYLEKKLKTRLKFLPNVRFDAREEKNDPAYAAELAAGQQLFVNESFATAHRAHASTHAITKMLPSVAGLQFEKEVRALELILKAPRTPLALIIGGAKLETKMPVIETFASYADYIFIVGALANAFFAARGARIGDSRVDEPSVAQARRVLASKRFAHKIILPIDVMVGRSRGVSKQFWQVALPDGDGDLGKICTGNRAILDSGPASLVVMSELLVAARTIIWNGPSGVFEREPFHLGSYRIARLLSKRGRDGAHIVAGGGETVTAIMQARAIRGYAHISTGGGALLEFLGGKKLPAVQALFLK